jgi:GDPmannose 4,6-dehydratase
MKRALIVGCHGQDGQLLFEQLKAKDYAIFGIGRSGCIAHGDLAKEMAKEHGLGVVDILEPSQVLDVFRIFEPDEVYYLAAFHHSADTKLTQTMELFTQSYDVHVLGLLCFLEAILALRPACRLFYAASSHTFGIVDLERITESTPLNPVCVYGITKTTGVQCCRLYRKQHGIFATVGFLFNHESIYRRADFLSQKIARAAVAIKLGLETELKLGDLSAVVDWGFAGDYTNAMERILSLDAPHDFIIASGIPRTVRDFVDVAFQVVGLDFQGYVIETNMPGLRRRPPLIGDPTFLKSSSGWEPSVSFHQMIDVIVRHEAAQRGLVLNAPDSSHLERARNPDVSH